MTLSLIIVGLSLVWLKLVLPTSLLSPKLSLIPKLGPENLQNFTALQPLSPHVSSELTKLVSDASSPKSEVYATAIGGLRVSNQTDYPVRIAIRARSLDTNTYKPPAHWDFAPDEGNLNGFSLSLPDGDVKVKKGDVLVAFAQDGSRRYWGPYIVGETPTPIWNQQAAEWQLILQP